MAGAPIGNQNARKQPRVWTDAINSALDKRHPKGRIAAMEELAGKLLDAVSVGDLQAIKELGDRLEGKPGQQVTLDGEVKLTALVKALDGDENL